MSSEELSLIVAEETGAPRATSDLEVRRGEEVRGERWDAFVAHVRPKRKEVDLDPVKADLDRVQGQIDTLLASVEAHDSERFRLSQVEVSLAISAEGSIGVATAGVQAGIALTFARL
jgi:hypothetical protein